MKRVTLFAAILISIFLNQNYSVSQVNADKLFVTPDNHVVSENFLAIELLPGQTFNGVAFYVPHVGATSNLQILQGSFIQSISPTSFTSTTCSTYTAVRLNYLAPVNTGIYYDTIVDLNHNWQNTIIELTVTNSPTLFRFDSTKTIVSGCTAFSNDVVSWTGVSLTSAEYCGPVPYVPRDVNGLPLPLIFQYSVYETQANWLSFSPPGGTVPFNNSTIVNKIFAGNNNLPNSIWSIRTNNWGAWPRYVRWTKNLITYTVNLISPVNGASNVNLTPTLDWNDVPASKYLVRLSLDSNFTSNLVNDTVTVSQITIQNGILIMNSTYYWKVTALRQSCTDITSGIYHFITSPMTAVNTITGEAVTEYKLFTNYPNPFNPATNIKFDLPKSSYVTLKIYNSTGKEVETIINEQLNAGSFDVNWNAVNYASGIYFYELSAGDFKETKKMALTK